MSFSGDFEKPGFVEGDLADFSNGKSTIWEIQKVRNEGNS